MVKLKETFNRDGYNHKIIWRDDEYCITELTDDITGKFVCLEAFKIKIRTSGHPNSTAEYPREAMPRDEDWGRYGFTIYTFDEAQKKIAFMRQKSINHKNKIKK